MFGIGLFTLYALSVARANDQLPNEMSTVEVSRSLLFRYGMGSMPAFGVFRFGDGSGRMLWILCLLCRFCGGAGGVCMAAETRAGRQTQYARGYARCRRLAVIADPDPRNDSGVLKPFDEAEAQAYAEALAQEAGAGEPPQAGA